MAKLFFRYGAMNCGKSTQLIQVAYNYEERHQQVLVWKSSLDNRDGVDTIRPRIGIERKVDKLITPDTQIMLIDLEKNNRLPDCILVDEAQFLTTQQVWDLTSIVDGLDIPVICFGLRTDAFAELFPGSAALMSLADTIEEIKTICWCGRKAIINSRLDENGNVLYSGEQVDVGHHYISLCRKHWKAGRTRPYAMD